MKKMQICLALGLIIGLLSPANEAQALRRGKRGSRVFKTGLANSSNSGTSYSRNQLAGALKAAQAGEFQNAAAQLFNLGRKADLKSERPQIKYILGLMLMEMKLYQTAAFQFVDVIRMKHPKYSKLSIEKLSIVADNLGDDTLLNYAVSRVDLRDVPASSTDMIYYRLGEIKQKNGQFAEAIKSYNSVNRGSSYYNQALFNRGLSLLELNETGPAIRVFEALVSLRSNSPITDTNKVSGQIALARAHYQAKDWDEAVQVYSQIPRDHRLWHGALFEQTWAMLRGARFRSALSNLQSLHSSYYENDYIPESLLLRSIIYLYICKYDEMEKVLSLFDRTYGPVRGRISEFMRMHRDSYSYYLEVEKAQAFFGDSEKANNLKIPIMVAKGVLDEGDVRRSLAYLKRLSSERSRIEESVFRNTPLGLYGLKILANRAKNTKLAIGDMVKAHLQDMKAELGDLYEQAGFVRYEMINGRKETIKKHIAGKDLPVASMDENVSRDFYIKNGYDYYPFKGEYWLDEIGNYHYLGKQSCE